MALRMLEYDLMLGFADARKIEEEFVIPLPRSCVIYLRHDGSTPDFEQASLVLQDGQTVKYRVPTIKVQKYNLDEMFEKKLYAYLPFYFMRYEKEFPKWERDEEKTRALQKECEKALMGLLRALEDRPEEFLNILEVMRKITDHVMRKQARLREGVDKVMGGKIWDLPSDRIREEKAAERAAGKAEGKADDVLELLEDLGEVPQELRDEIHAEKNLEELSRMHKLAAKVKSIEEFQIKSIYEQ